MPNLRIVPPQMSGTSSSSAAASSPLSSSQSHDHHHQQHHHKIYQLCACSNGKLFLAMSHSICAGDVSTVCSWFYTIHKNEHFRRADNLLKIIFEIGYHLMDEIKSICSYFVDNGQIHEPFSVRFKLRHKS